MKDLLLFDVDGTLTVPRNKITNDMIDILKILHNDKNVEIGFVGGSNLEKQIEQLGEENFYLFTHRFSENGLLYYKGNNLIETQKFSNYFGEELFKKLINICLYVLSETDYKIKRGTFIEYRNGLINISPIGRGCSQDERDEFYEYDLKNKLREKMINQIKKKWIKYLIDNEYDLKKYELNFSIGGQISVDIFPVGWDKTYCLKFIKDSYNKIYFFGDKTSKGGNDYEIYNNERVIGNYVKTYNDTINILKYLIQTKF